MYDKKEGRAVAQRWRCELKFLNFISPLSSGTWDHVPPRLPKPLEREESAIAEIITRGLATPQLNPVWSMHAKWPINLMKYSRRWKRPMRKTLHKHVTSSWPKIDIEREDTPLSLSIVDLWRKLGNKWGVWRRQDPKRTRRRWGTSASKIASIVVDRLPNSFLLTSRDARISMLAFYAFQGSIDWPLRQQRSQMQWWSRTWSWYHIERPRADSV